MNEKSYFAHPTAVIDEGASIGEGCKIWHYTHIMSGATLQRNCTIGQNVFIGDKVTLGEGCKVQNNVSLYEGVLCESGVFIGPSAVFTNVVNPRAFIERKTEFRQTVLQEGASVGANATIVCGHVLGRFCLVAAGAVVTSDVPPFTIVGGNPAREMGYISRHGEKLVFTKDNTTAKCPATGITYLLKDGLVTELTEENSQAIDKKYKNDGRK